jgi:predicted anti-sigma-YlaC factor YlaD
MNCTACREALSAQIDGEDDRMSAALVDEHLHGCAACAEWQRRAVRLTRSLRVHAVTPTPQLTAAILSTVDSTGHGLPHLARRRRAPRARARARPGTRLTLARFGLAAVGWTQLGLGQLQLVDGLRPSTNLGSVDHTNATHLFNESVAWTIAIAVGMLWAAAQTRRAAGLLSALLGAVVVLAGLSAHDLINQSVAAPRVATHALLLAGLGLVYLVDRGHQATAPRPRGAGRRRPDLPAAEAGTDLRAVRRRLGGRAQAPASRHRAA